MYPHNRCIYMHVMWVKKFTQMLEMAVNVNILISMSVVNHGVYLGTMSTGYHVNVDAYMYQY